MSYWSAEVLGSDDANDWRAALLEAGGIDVDAFLDEGGGVKWRKPISIALPMMLAHVAENGGIVGDYEIGMQVLGTLVLCTGAPLPEDIRRQVIGAARGDSRAQDDLAREAAMARFIEQLRSYPSEGGEPIDFNGRH